MCQDLKSSIKCKWPPVGLLRALLMYLFHLVGEYAVPGECTCMGMFSWKGGCLPSLLQPSAYSQRPGLLLNFWWTCSNSLVFWHFIALDFLCLGLRIGYLSCFAWFKFSLEHDPVKTWNFVNGFSHVFVGQCKNDLKHLSTSLCGIWTMKICPWFERW